MTLKYLKKLHPILNKVGKRHGIPVDEGEFVIGEFFKSFKEAIYDPRIPKVKLPLFGTFQPKISYINRSLRASIRFHRKGGTTREYINSRIRRIWPVRNRLIDEQRGAETWRLWRGKDIKDKFIQLEQDEQEKKIASKSKVYGSGDNRKKSKEVFREIQTGLRIESSQGRQPRRL